MLSFEAPRLQVPCFKFPNFQLLLLVMINDYHLATNPSPQYPSTGCKLEYIVTLVLRVGLNILPEQMGIYGKKST